MRAIAAFVITIAAGLALYVLVFTTVIRQPLTIDEIGRYMTFKQQILHRTPAPRIVILAGSNGRFSHSCVAITAVSGIPCANLSINASIGLRYQIDAWLPGLRAGDLVYLPLEYRIAGYFDPAFIGDESSYLMAQDARRLLPLYGWHGLPRAVLQFDLRNLVGGLGEMALAAHGTTRRFGTATLNAAGDEQANTAIAARAFAAYRAALPAATIDQRAYADDRYWTDVAEAIARLRAGGMLVVGGLPTTFNDTQGVDSAEAFLRRFYESRGACFLTLPNRSLYPRADFYDGSYHLAQPGQQRHSELLAVALAKSIGARNCAKSARRQHAGS